MALPRLLKWTLWIIATISGLLVVAVLLMSLLFSHFIGEPSKDEVARVVSPNGKLDAVLLETNGGATTSFGYEVYVLERGIQASGSPVVSLYSAVRNQSAYGANLRWETSDLLAVEFLSTKTSDMKKPVVYVGGQSIKVVMREGVLDPVAPPGGMHYNLQNQR